MWGTQGSNEGERSWGLIRGLMRERVAANGGEEEVADHCGHGILTGERDVEWSRTKS